MGAALEKQAWAQEGTAEEAIGPQSLELAAQVTALVTALVVADLEPGALLVETTVVTVVAGAELPVPLPGATVAEVLTVVDAAWVEGADDCWAEVVVTAAALVVVSTEVDGAAVAVA